MSIVTLAGFVYLTSELALAVFKRAKAAETRAADRGSLRLLWVVIAVSVFLAYQWSFQLPSLSFGATPGLAAAPVQAVAPVIGVALFLGGLGLRWYSIRYLGRFFTVNVAIAADHRLIDGGPYRRVRHPSYSGALLAFAGLGICLQNWASLATILVPTFLVFSRRMRIEEDALIAGLGDRYRDYMRRTKRLIPALY